MENKKSKYYNREFSWLGFNYRVLQEAIDQKNPLLERLKFLGIFSNNLDEFYRVRVATIKRMVNIQDKDLSEQVISPEDTLAQIKKTAIEQQSEFNKTFETIINDLKKQNIYIVNELDIDKNQKKYIKILFNEKLRSHIVPIILDKSREFPFIEDSKLYFVLKLFNKNFTENALYAIMELPTNINRFVILPNKNQEEKTFIMLLDDIIRYNLKDVFSLFDYDKILAFVFKITRDAELDIEDDLSTSILKKIEKGVEKRKIGSNVRFVFDENMPLDLYNLLKNNMKLKDNDNLIPGGRYHNFKDFINFPQLSNKSLYYKPYKHTKHNILSKTNSIIKEIINKDIFLYFPYHSFIHIIDLLRESAIDPCVKKIKINLYRVSKKSNIINAIVNAAKNGKKVEVVIELNARFDEKNNIYWSNYLEENGVKVIFGVKGLKVHSKLIYIEREENGNLQKIVHIGTGNFHEGNAKIYTDISILTHNEKIASDVKKIFDFFKNNYKLSNFDTLFVSPYNTRLSFIELIDKEIENSKNNKIAKITLKLNNLLDQKLIDKLYQASNAGVEIHLIIRGICTLISGVKGMSENIKSISIVGKFLEHSRIIIFHNDNDPKVFISSADWMERNLDYRIEVTTPIFDKQIKNKIIKITENYLLDNTKARSLQHNHINEYIKKSGSELYDSQNNIFEILKTDELL